MSSFSDSKKRPIADGHDASDAVIHFGASSKRFCSSKDSVIDPLNQSQTSALPKWPIGLPVIFPNGIGTNYSYFPRARDISLLSEDTSSSLSTVSSSSLQMTVERKHEDSQTSNPETFLPPRHRRPRNRLGENVKLNGRFILLCGLSPKFTEKEIGDLIQDSGFTARVAVDGCSASLEFLHPNVASAASSVLQHRAQILWDRTGGNLEQGPTGKNSHLTRLGATRAPEVIDLTAVTDILDAFDDDPIFNTFKGQQNVETPEGLPFFSTFEAEPILNTVENDPYKNMLKDAYSEDDDDGGSSDASMSPSPTHRLSPGMEYVSLTTGNIQDRIETHLSKIFAPPEVGTRINNNGMNTARPKARQRKPSASRTTFPTPRDTFRNDESETHVVALPKASHNKPRRVLLPNDSVNLPIVTVSMRADVQFFDRNKRHRISKISRPNDSVYRHAVDATIVGATAIIGYGNGPCQVSLVRLSKGRSPSFIELQHNHPHKVSLDAGSRTGNGAISCLTAKGTTNNATQFFTGGYDKTLTLWSVGNADLTTTERITTLTTIPEALGFRDRSLIVGTSRKILTVDLGHLSSTPAAAQLSNAVSQIHVHNQAPNLTILEVNSLDFQVQIFDNRIKRGFDRVSDCYFGARQSHSIARSTRGDTNFSMFVKGYGDGTVSMWDYRNSKKPILIKKYRDIGSVVHTVFAGPNIICYGDNNLTFIDISGGGSQ